MKLYRCIVDDGNHAFAAYVGAKSKKDLLSQYGGNGDFVKIEDVTGDTLTEESPDMLADTLARSGWGEAEREVICALVREHLSGR